MNTLNIKNMIENPLDNLDIMSYVYIFLKAVIIAAVPILILMMTFSGFKFILARGSSNELSQAKDILKKVLFLTIAILSIGVLFKLIINLLNTIFSSIS